jgi:hypothetical protein
VVPPGELGVDSKKHGRSHGSVVSNGREDWVSSLAIFSCTSGQPTQF